MKVSGVPEVVFWRRICWALIALCVCVRILVAWLLRNTTYEDFGIIALMAKHMAEGLHFPVFYYGQSYMGSLEFIPAALLIRLTGCSPFAVCLGTALVASLIPVVLYRWVSAAWNRRAAAAALLATVVGPWGAQLYFATPRGGYAALSFLGTAAIWLAGSMAARAAQEKFVSNSRFLLLGLLCGLAWWTHPISVAHLATVGIVLLAGFQWRIFRRGLLWAAAGAVAGAGPWLGWNFTHGWQSLSMAATFGQVPADEGLRDLGKVIVKLLTPESHFDVVKFLVIPLFLIAPLVVAWALGRTWRERHRSGSFFHLLAAFVLVAATAVIYSTSHYARFGAVRYVLHLLPVAALMVGIATDILFTRWKTAWVWVPVTLYALLQFSILQVAFAFHQKEALKWPTHHLFVDFARLHGIDAYVGDYGVHHWMNFASREQICVSDIGRERYAPYYLAASLARHPAVLDDYQGFKSFLAQTDASYKQARLADHDVYFDLSPSSNGWAYVDAQDIASVRDGQGQDLSRVIADNALFTAYKPGSEQAQVVWSFKEAVPLCGLRLFGLSRKEGPSCRLEVIPAGAGEFIEVSKPHKPNLFFWSGPHFYWSGLFRFAEYRFSPQLATAMRLTLEGGSGQPLSLPEAIPLRASEQAEGAGFADLDQLQEKLRADGVNELFAPRWVCEFLHERTKGQIRTPLPAAYQRTIQDARIRLEPSMVQLPPVTTNQAFLVWAQDAPRNRTAFAARGLVVRESTVGPWHLFRPDTDATADESLLEFPEMEWGEQGCFLRNPMDYPSKRQADWLYRAALEKLQSTTVSAKAEQDLRKALQLYPAHQLAVRALADYLRRQGREEDGMSVLNAYDAVFAPATPLKATFDNGVELVGLTVKQTRLAPGDVLEMSWYWRCPPTVSKDAFMFFVHLEGRQTRFQDDHPLLNGVAHENVTFQPFQETFVIRRTVLVPPSIPPGTYQVEVGLVNRKGQRLRIKSDLPTRHSILSVPLTLEIQDAAH